MKISDYLFHVAVSIWIKNQYGNILLPQRHPDKPWGLKWGCSGGGSVLVGESATEGLREDFERKLELYCLKIS